jgi:cyclic-di-GMP-binding biofilm dispersal mediator protein
LPDLLTSASGRSPLAIHCSCSGPIGGHHKEGDHGNRDLRSHRRHRQALAQALQGRGRLWLTGRNEAALFELAETLGAEAEAMDLSDETAVQAFLAEIGPVDRLFYAAGAVSPAPLAQTDREAWERTFTANLWGAFLALKHARWGAGARGVFLGAYPQRIALPGLGAYAASKWALEGLLTVARRELRGVRLMLVRGGASGYPGALRGGSNGLPSPARGRQRLPGICRLPV